jgi:hypothetical protein
MSKGTGRAGRAVAALLLVAVAAGCDLPADGAESPADAPAKVDGPPAKGPDAAKPTEAAAVPIRDPAHGGGTWTYAGAAKSARNGGGKLWRYRVAAERDIKGIPVDGFAATVAETLNDPRGWTAGGTARLRRVGRDAASDFTIYLSTPDTRDDLCGAGEDGYTSCRNGEKVVLNVARWTTGVPKYGAGLDVYRQYMVNHEVGHRLGNGHELCTGKGKPAPVMEQQTLGLHGCTANPWPYLDGRRYAGRSGAYDDPVPPPSGGAT